MRNSPLFLLFFNETPKQVFSVVVFCFFFFNRYFTDTMSDGWKERESQEIGARTDGKLESSQVQVSRNQLAHFKLFPSLNVLHPS